MKATRISTLVLAVAMMAATMLVFGGGVNATELSEKSSTNVDDIWLTGITREFDSDEGRHISTRLLWAFAYSFDDDEYPLDFDGQAQFALGADEADEDDLIASILSGTLGQRKQKQQQQNKDVASRSDVDDVLSGEFERRLQRKREQRRMDAELLRPDAEELRQKNKKKNNKKQNKKQDSSSSSAKTADSGRSSRSDSNRNNNQKSNGNNNPKKKKPVPAVQPKRQGRMASIPIRSDLRAVASHLRSSIQAQRSRMQRLVQQVNQLTGVKSNGRSVSQQLVSNQLSASSSSSQLQCARVFPELSN